MSEVENRHAALWGLWERDTFFRFIAKLPAHCRIVISDHGGCDDAVMRCWADRSVRITFENSKEPRAVYVTRQAEGAPTQIRWFRGGLSEWLDVLEVSRDELISALVNWEEKR